MPIHSRLLRRRRLNLRKGGTHLWRKQMLSFAALLSKGEPLPFTDEETEPKLTTLLFKIHIYSTEIKVLIKRGTISRIWRYYFCLLVI